MKARTVMKRFLSLLLAAAMLAVPLPAKAEEPVGNTGTISATIRLDCPQTLEVLQSRNIEVSLKKDGNPMIEDLSMTEASSNDAASGRPASAVILRNPDGGVITGSEEPGYLDVSFPGLAPGNYSLHFTGTGYVPFSQDVELKDTSKHVILGTGDATFTLGDVDGDGKVTAKDRNDLSAALGSTTTNDLNQFDLNGDGEIDIVDLAYVSHHIKAVGEEATVLDTNILNPSVDLNHVIANPIIEAGDPEDLFIPNGKTVTLKSDQPISEDAPLAFEIPFTAPQEMGEIQIHSPEGDAPVTGDVTVTFDDNTSEKYPFDLTPPEDVHALNEIPGSSVITISLGRRVPVKKITITVTKVAGTNNYTVVESIRFLKDIVPENPVQENIQVKNLKAVAGDGRVTLSWNQLPNMSGYRVDYSLRDVEGETRSLPTDRNQIEVTGLENLKTYSFTVTPVDGSWTGKPSEPVYETPLPASAPKAPDMVRVTSQDSALQVSWKVPDNATFYEVYYKAESDSGYRQWESQFTTTSTTITGLTNKVEYSIYIIAGNSIGKSGPSNIHTGIPLATDYSRPEGIPTEGVIDYTAIASIRLADAGNVSGTSYTADKPFQPSFMADNDFTTHWTSQSYYDGNWARSKQVICTFKEPQDLSCVIWVPRMDGDYKNNLRLYNAIVWKDGQSLTDKGTLLVPDPNRGGTEASNQGNPVGGNPGVNRFAVLPLEPVTNVKQIAITIEQRAYTAVSLSELMFLKYDPEKCLPDIISALFADDLRTALKTDVTQAKIDELTARLNSDERNYYLDLEAMEDELSLAKELLTNGRSSGVMVNGIQSRSNGADAQKYGQSGSDLQPLGVAANAKGEITIYAEGIPDGQSVSVIATQYFAEASTWRATAGTLKNGRNLIAIPQIGSQNTPRGGSLYLTYSGTNPEGIRLHIRRGTAIPKLELTDWYSIDQTERETRIGTYLEELYNYVPTITGTVQQNCLNLTEISMPSVLLSLPAAAVQNSLGTDKTQAITKLYQNVLAWEDVMHLCKTTQGIDKTYAVNDMTSRQNIRCMQMFGNAFMYAAGNHVGIGYGSCGGMVCGQPISDNGALFGWGIAHEIGHNMDKLGKAEITNNIYSLVLQTADTSNFTKESRLEASGKYPKIFTKTAQGYPGDSNDVFLQLGLYWQLHLAYDEAAPTDTTPFTTPSTKPIDFYNRFFKAWKDGTYTKGAATYGDRLALTASGVANRDLSEFFTRWGVVLSENAKTTIEALPEESRAVWYLSDASRRARLNNTSPASGTLAVTATLANDNEITLDITESITGEIQGYEIRRSSDGGKTFKAIDFTADTTYKDVIGSANHRTFKYQVAAYDILGNEICSNESSEVRVAYDKVVDSSAYEIVRDEENAETVIITMNEPTAVSGLKIANIPEDGLTNAVNGEFSVNITANIKNEDGTITEKTTTARSGNFSAGNQAVDDAKSYVTYFQKPGVTSEDTRIWTYDAETVVVTGIPEEVALENVQLISYAGDDIAFLDAGSVGVLERAYDCGNGDVLDAGTLIVTGTYRGDPLWNIIEVEGNFISTTVNEKDEQVTTEEPRAIDGEIYMFAEVPADGAVSDISDGLFIFVPNVQKEAELQGEEHDCSATNLLPAQMRAVLYRTDEVDNAQSKRVTAQTLWINSPGGTDLPKIILEEGGTGA